MKNKIFITGANGFIGKYVTTQLSNKGYDIRILTRTKKINSKNLKMFHGQLAI
jgi:nucleoside-diphosphate-sugar epimerase